jgi:hypothetical protein
MDPAGRVLEFIRCLHHRELRAGDQVVGLQDTINTGFRHEVVVRIGDVPCQLSGRQFRPIQRHLDDQSANRFQ